MDSEEYSDSDSSYSEISSESDGDVSLDDARNWCRLDEDNLISPLPRYPFTGNPGIKVQIYNSSPLEFFGMFLMMTLSVTLRVKRIVSLMTTLKIMN
ncbi:hypothetical protein AVEN_113430-1 [Araneus ventricosus]|uniref:Uncharacterized protein n=1 Tax=Araneus ventricosus TaxID=182803 RepID=A0A4Y2NXX3_ARAVE|nr:hypothetical protein AVEN_79256-1 [Araneus ventricosus]GBN43120.1 hypothetical protein AVEN_113430-1 [Araneus ventricosus]